MNRSKEEIAEELDSLRKIVRMLRKRRFILEEQMATEGIQVRPERVIEVESLIEQINAREHEIVQLEIHVVEDQLPLGEAEYQVQLAEAWSPLQGRPTVTGMANLELMRLRLGIAPERAKEIEQSVRSQLAEERLADIRLVPLNQEQEQDNLQRVLCAWRLDPEATHRVLCATNRLPDPDDRRSILWEKFRELASIMMWLDPQERLNFLAFLDK